MSDIELDPNFVSAVDTLVEAEAARRVAIDRYAFRFYASITSDFHQEKYNLEVMLRMEAGEEEGSPEEALSTSAARAKGLSYAAEQERAELEEQEDLFGRRRILLDEAEDAQRLFNTALYYELALIANEAFSPCMSKVYSHAWGTVVDKVLPMPPHALDKLNRNPERHIPQRMRREERERLDSVKAWRYAEHEEHFKQTKEQLQQTTPATQVALEFKADAVKAIE